MILVVKVAETLPAKDEVKVAFGSGKIFRYIAAHQIEARLGSEKSRALPLFHALTGCDTIVSVCWTCCTDYMEFVPRTY